MSDNKNAVGKATVGQTLKNRWRKEGKGLSLKQFARKLVASGDSVAQEWFDRKHGLMDLDRSDKNKARIMQEKQAAKSGSSRK